VNFGVRKLESRVVWHYPHDPTFSSFDTIPECDRQTDTRRRHIPRLAYHRALKIAIYQKRLADFDEILHNGTY